MSTPDFSGKVAVVTGASSGIGRATALALARAGARVCAAARREDRLQDVVEEAGGSAQGHSYVVTDVSERAQVQKLAAHVADTYGRCDALVNNAGVGERSRFTGPESIDELERVMATNYLGAVYCTGELLDLLKSSAPSNVVNVTSVAGRVAVPGMPAYSSSKFALTAFTESLRPVLAKRGVQIATIEPGFVPTEGFAHEKLKRHPVMRRLLVSESEVAAAILDLIGSGKAARTIPRAYYLLQLPRVLAPRLHGFAVKKMVGGRKRATER